jgi:hypothetical protein
LNIDCQILKLRGVSLWRDGVSLRASDGYAGTNFESRISTVEIQPGATGTTGFADEWLWNSWTVSGKRAPSKGRQAPVNRLTKNTT